MIARLIKAAAITTFASAVAVASVKGAVKHHERKLADAAGRDDD